MDTLYCTACRQPGALWRRHSGDKHAEFFAVCSSAPCIAATIGMPMRVKRQARDSSSGSDSDSDSESDPEWRDQRRIQRHVQPHVIDLTLSDEESQPDDDRRQADMDEVLAPQTPSSQSPLPLPSFYRRSMTPPSRSPSPPSFSNRVSMLRSLTPSPEPEEAWPAQMPVRRSPSLSPLVPVDTSVIDTTYDAVNTVTDAHTLAALAAAVPVVAWGRMYQHSGWFRQALDRAEVRARLVSFMVANRHLLLETTLQARAHQLRGYVLTTR